MGRDEVRLALEEDRATDDQTTRLLGAGTRKPGTLRFVAEGRFVVAGVPVIGEVFTQLHEGTQVDPGVPEGVWAHPGDTLATVKGPMGVLLSGERVALNFLQRLCGIATLTRRAVDAVRGKAKIAHTRKTTPGLRTLERYAVLVGGGVENRASLADAILWKDNHWELMSAEGGSLADVLKKAPRGLPVIVEVETEAQLSEALAAGVKHLLIDNQPPEQFSKWARRAGPDVTLQASGGITVDNVAAYAAAGAHLISMGALTHSAPAVSIKCELSK